MRGVPTSNATAALAAEVGIPLLELAEAGRLDVTFDGADEVDPQLEVIKGYGGALVPARIPWFSDVINRYCAPLPLINRLCLSQYIVARPLGLPCDVEETVSIVVPCRNEKGNIEMR